jgi:phosphatidate cytidylyltransferase
MKRVLTAVWLVPFGACSIFLAPHWLFVLIVAALATLCFREYARIVEQQGIESHRIAGTLLGLAIILVPGVSWMDLMILGPVALALGLRVADFRAGFASSAALILGILYTYGAWRAGIGLHDRGAHWLFFAAALNWAGDVSAYYVGRAIGKRKLAPVISPNKSVEGAVASVVASTVFGLAYFHFAIPEVSWWMALIYSIAGNLAGQLGDLCESAMKRGANMKDSGTMLAGHGGWLDRLDSSLFSMPAVYWVMLLSAR